MRGVVLKAGRVLAGLEQHDLAKQARLAVNTVRALEAAGYNHVAARTESVRRVMDALIRAGVVVTEDGVHFLDAKQGR